MVNRADVGRTASSFSSTAETLTSLAKLGRQSTEYLPVVGVLSEASSGRALTVLSSEPIVQTYYSTLLGGLEPGKGGAVSHFHKHTCCVVGPLHHC